MKIKNIYTFLHFTYFQQIILHHRKKFKKMDHFWLYIFWTFQLGKFSTSSVVESHVFVVQIAGYELKIAVNLKNFQKKNKKMFDSVYNKTRKIYFFEDFFQSSIDFFPIYSYFNILGNVNTLKCFKMSLHISSFEICLRRISSFFRPILTPRDTIPFYIFNI